MKEPKPEKWAYELGSCFLCKEKHEGGGLVHRECALAYEDNKNKRMEEAYKEVYKKDIKP